MVNKRQLQACVDSCVKEVQASASALSLTESAIKGSEGSAEDKKRMRSEIAGASMLRLGLAWELFIDDWLVCSIAKDLSTLRHNLEKLREKADEDLPPELKLANARVEMPALGHPDLQTLRLFLDPSGRNVALPSRADLTKGHRYLTHRRTQSLVSAARQTNMAAMHAAIVRIRDVLAHDSPASRKEVATALTVLGVYFPALRVPAAKSMSRATLQRFLASTPSRLGSSRAAFLHQQAVVIAQAFPVA